MGVSFGASWLVLAGVAGLAVFAFAVVALIVLLASKSGDSRKLKDPK